MENESRFSPSVMKGGGAYNSHARLQAAGARSTMPFLEKAVRDVTLDSADLPVVIADYGSSQSKNSPRPDADCSRKPAAATRRGTDAERAAFRRQAAQDWE
jgi:hypothetical protein